VDPTRITKEALRGAFEHFIGDFVLGAFDRDEDSSGRRSEFHDNVWSVMLPR
jgi:hypothetical protein